MADNGGVLNVSTLSTGEIHTDGGIAPGTPDLTAPITSNGPAGSAS